MEFRNNLDDMHRFIVAAIDDNHVAIYVGRKKRHKELVDENGGRTDNRGRLSIYRK